MELLIVAIAFWIFIKIVTWLWPIIKFGALFVGAVFVLGSWFVFKETSGLGVILGVIVVITSAYQFAKAKA